MPPKSTSAGGARGRTKATKAQPAKATASDEVDQDLDPFASSAAEDETEGAAPAAQRPAQEDRVEAEKVVPRELLTRILHEFFAKDATRMSRDANAAVGKYVDVFVREAIARTAVEKRGGFLEVEDLEKISPQLLLDL